MSVDYRVAPEAHLPAAGVPPIMPGLGGLFHGCFVLAEALPAAAAARERVYGEFREA